MTMGNDSIILACPSCGAKNRIPLSRMDETAKCGKCKTPLPMSQLSQPVNVTDGTFDAQVISSPLPVLVDCWAPWCGPCRAFGPVIDQLAQVYRGRLKVAKLNLDENPGIGSRYSISSVPTVLFIKNGQVVDTRVGALPRDQLDTLIARFL